MSDYTVTKDRNDNVFIDATGRSYLCEPSDRAVEKFLPATSPSRGWIFTFIMLLGDGPTIKRYGLNKIFQQMEGWVMADDVWHAVNAPIISIEEVGPGIHPTQESLRVPIQRIRRSAFIDPNIKRL